VLGDNEADLGPQRLKLLRIEIAILANLPDDRVGDQNQRNLNKGDNAVSGDSAKDDGCRKEQRDVERFSLDPPVELRG